MKIALVTCVLGFLLAMAWSVAGQGGGSGGRGIRVSRESERSSREGPAEYFTGSVNIQMLFAAEAPGRTSAARVTFQPGARTAWHRHPLGQVLIVTDGAGWVQEWGEPAVEIRPGDVVRIAPGVKHWHGAKATTAMTHIAIQEQLEGKTAEWLEKVTDEQYPK